MRIIGYIDHPVLKITIFDTTSRMIVKFENAHFEQNYKIRKGDNLNNLEQITQLVDEKFLEQVYANFNGMGKALVETFKRNKDKNTDLPNTA